MTFCNMSKKRYLKISKMPFLGNESVLIYKLKQSSYLCQVILEHDCGVGIILAVE